MAHHELANLIAVVDYNKLQSLGRVEEVLDLEPFVAKWEAFRWHTQRIDGHDHAQIKHALDVAAVTDAPSVIIADTVKGKGVSFMENRLLWHYRPPSDEQLEAALAELEVDK